MNKPHNERFVLQTFREQSYFVIRSLLPRLEREKLRSVCDSALAAARSESAVKGHSSPSISLFANAHGFDGDPRALEHLLSFASSARICALLDGLAHPGEESTPRIKKSDYYHEQTVRDWDGDWHRDSQFVETSPEREEALILTSTWVHLRFAFEPDDRLEIVPGSHLRWDTVEELRIRKGSRRAHGTMPQALRIALDPGDACIFHAWSIHRATYRRSPLRRTLDCLYAFGSAPSEPPQRFRP